MNLRNVRLVYLKEIRDTLRDRRTLFISVVLPILLYPLLMIGFSQVVMTATSRIREDTQAVAVKGGEDVPGLTGRLAASDPPLEVVEEADPEVAFEEGRIAAWVSLADDFAAAIAEGRQGGLAIHFDSTKEASKIAQWKIRRVLEGYSRSVLEDRGLTEADIDPVRVEDADRASKEQRGAKQLGPMLVLLLVIMALSGAFYPAVDIMAGEKERGTMETLLVCPARRTEIVVGKYLTVLTMTLVGALLNFLSMGLTFSHFVHFIPKSGGGMALQISPMVAGVIVLALLPLAGLFSALALALSTFARTYKEGQYYLTPLFVAVMPLALVAVVPATKLETFALVPVSGVALLVRDLLLGSAGAFEVLLVILSTALFAGLAIAWSVAMFNREDVLFRDPGGTEFTLFARARERGGVPTAGQGLVVAALSLALVFVAVPWVMKLDLGHPGAVAFLFQQIVLVLGLPLLAILWYRLDLRRSLSLRVPRPAAWPAVLIGAPSVFAIAAVVTGWIGVDEEALEPLAREIKAILDSLGYPLVLVLPPIAEEVMFRGFLLSGFRRGRKAAVAVAIVAALFAFFHLTPQKYVPTAMVGLWLGYVVVATRSLYPSILSHLLNNAIPFGLMWLSGRGVDPLGPEGVVPDWALAPAVVGVAVAVWLLERVRRAGAPGGAGGAESD